MRPIASRVAWIVCALLACPATAAVEANVATQAELEQLSGVGPDLAARIIEARKQQPFSNWADFRSRVRGVGAQRARQLTEQGLTIRGRGYGQPEPE